MVQFLLGLGLAYCEYKKNPLFFVRLTEMSNCHQVGHQLIVVADYYLKILYYLDFKQEVISLVLRAGTHAPNHRLPVTGIPAGIDGNALALCVHAI